MREYKLSLKTSIKQRLNKTNKKTFPNFKIAHSRNLFVDKFMEARKVGLRAKLVNGLEAKQLNLLWKDKY